MVCRFFLGVAEAMFGPGVPLYLTVSADIRWRLSNGGGEGFGMVDADGCYGDSSSTPANRSDSDKASSSSAPQWRMPTAEPSPTEFLKFEDL